MFFLKTKLNYASQFFFINSISTFILNFCYSKSNLFLNLSLYNSLMKSISYKTNNHNNYIRNIMIFFIYLFYKNKKKNIRFNFSFNGIIKWRKLFLKNLIYNFLKTINFNKGSLTLNDNNFWPFNGCRKKKKKRKRKRRKKKWKYINLKKLN